jgi:transposase
MTAAAGIGRSEPIKDPMLLAQSELSKIRRRPAELLRHRDRCRLPEVTRSPNHPNLLAGILVALSENASNARTEGFNRIIKQNKGAAAATAT